VNITKTNRRKEKLSDSLPPPSCVMRTIKITINIDIIARIDKEREDTNLSRSRMIEMRLEEDEKHIQEFIEKVLNRYFLLFIASNRKLQHSIDAYSDVIKDSFPKIVCIDDIATETVKIITEYLIKVQEAKNDIEKEVITKWFVRLVHMIKNISKTE